MTRELTTPQGVICYTLTRKRVKNINLRVRAGGEVAVSAPSRAALRDIDGFVASKADWIQKNRRRMEQAPPPAPPGHSREECLALFQEVSDEVFPLFADLLDGQKPTLRVRDMRSRWGTCHIAKRIITLNMRLADKPRPLVEYVVLHEYVHFLHPNHQSGFHKEMARLMPDYKQRRSLLRKI